LFINDYAVREKGAILAGNGFQFNICFNRTRK
jgi:hypothetical protein